MSNGTGETITLALQSAGIGDLPDAAKAWAADRLVRYRYSPQALNIGGIGCTMPHDHTDSLCLPAVHTVAEKTGEWQQGKLRYLARFPTWDDAARVFVGVARRAGAEPHAPAHDLVEVGFRSTHPAYGEEVGGSLLDDAKTAFDLVSPLTTSLIFGPSAEAEGVFRGLLADWQSFERAGVPKDYPELKDTYASWTPFRDAWVSGKPDLSALNSQVSDANRVRKTLAERTKDPQFQAPARAGVDIEDASSALHTAAEVVRATAHSPLDATDPLGWLKAWWKDLTPQTKIGVGALGVLVGGGALTYVSMPLLIPLGMLGGHAPQVIVVEPPARTAPRRKGSK